MTTVNNIIASVKKRVDYDITDTDLDALLLDILNDGSTWLRQKLIDAGLRKDIGKSGSFVVLEGAEYGDVRISRVFGDATTFTGTAGDKLKVTIDGTDYDDIDIAAATDIDDVVTDINTAVGATVATKDTSGNLVITSPTTDGTGSVTVADGSTTGQTVVGDLFTDADQRTDTGINDIDQLLRVRDKVGDNIIDIYNFEDLVEQEPDEDNSSNTYPYMVARWDNPYYLYFRSKLSESRRFYIDYFPYQTELSAGDTLPFIRKYDPILKQYCRVEFFAWKFADDPNNAQFVREEGKLSQLVSSLVTFAAKDFGKNQQTSSRRSGRPYGPRYNVGLPEYDS